MSIIKFKKKLNFTAKLIIHFYLQNFTQMQIPYQLIQRYQKQWHYLSEQFNFIKKRYFRKDDLQQQIKQLKNAIEMKLKMLQEENQLNEMRKKVMENRNNPVNGQFSHVRYLKEIKVPHEEQRGQKHDKPSNTSISIPIYPNRKLTLKLTIRNLQPVISIQNNTKLNQFPSFFRLHLHHIDNYLHSSLNFDNIYGLSRIQDMVSYQYHRKNLHNSKGLYHHHNLAQCCQLSSQIVFTLQYTFDYHNMDLYTQLFTSEQQFVNLIFSITNIHDQSNVVIAMAKFNLNQLLKSYYQKFNTYKIDDFLVNHFSYQTLYFHKMISFNHVCPIEELPLMCKINVQLQVKEELISGPLQDYQNLQVQKDPLGKKDTQLYRSPRKVIQKTPQKRNNNQEVIMGRSPHHKRQYIRNLLQQGSTQPKKMITLITRQEDDYLSPVKYDKEKVNNKKQPMYSKKLTIFENYEFDLILRQNDKLENYYQPFNFSGEYFHYIEDQLSQNDIHIGQTTNINLLKTKLTPVVNFIQHKSDYKKSDIQQQSQDSYTSTVQYFVIKIIIQVSLTNKRREGKIFIKLPFVQKLNKLITSETGRFTQVHSSYEITVKPNNLFKIQEYENSKSQEPSLRLSKKASSTDRESNMMKQKSIKNENLRNKIIRLENNLYLISQNLGSIKIRRNLNVINMSCGSISKFYFNLSMTKEECDEQDIVFDVYPFGTEFEVGKSAGGNYVIMFKVDERQYKQFRCMQNGRDLQKIQSKEVESNQRNETMLIEMAVSCQCPIRDQETQMTQWVTQLQYFTVRLSLTPGSVYSCRQINVNENDQFYRLEMNQIIKFGSRVNVSANDKSILHIVNGYHFTLDEENQCLVFQLLIKINSNQSVKTVIVIDNWEQGQTSFLELHLVNKQKTIIQSSSKNQSSQQDPNLNQQKIFISMGKSIKKQQL